MLQEIKKHTLYIYYGLMWLVLTGAYSYFYVTDPSCPDLCKNDSLGWYNWWDQSQYCKIAYDLTNFKLDKPQYWIGYPLLGSVFIKILPHHPFLVPNYFFMMLMAFCLFSVAKKFINDWEAALVTIISLLYDRLFWVNCIIWPWNSIVSFGAIFYLVYYFSCRNKNIILECFKYLLIGLSILSRPSDGLIIVLFWLLLSFAEQNINIMSFIYKQKYFFLFILGSFACNIICNYISFSSFSNSYMHVVTDSVGFSFSNILIKAYQWLVNPSLLYPDSVFLPPDGSLSRGVLERAPYIFLAIPGLSILAKFNSRKVILFILFSISFIIFYLGFNPMSYPPHMWSYHGYHYYWWIIPWCIFLAYLMLTRGWNLLCNKKNYFYLFALPLLILVFSYKKTKIPLVFEKTFVTETTNTITHERLTKEKKAIIKYSTSNNHNGKIFSIVLTADGNVLPYHLTVASKVNATKIKMNNKDLRTWVDFLACGEPGTVCISFLNNPLNEQNGTLEISFANEEDVNIKDIQFFTVQNMLSSYLLNK
jgi:hypothetical protein